MGPDFDEGSFKKARSFLLVFSTMLIILWYFNAEMSTLSILGNSIKFSENTQDIWLALSIVNAYFFCRFFQHLPEDWNKPSEKLEILFNSTLCRATALVYRKKLHSTAWTDLIEDHDSSQVMNFKVHPDGSRYRVEEERMHFFPARHPEIKVVFSLPCTWISPRGGECSSTGVNATIAPHRSLVFYSQVSSFIKGVFLAPWFTEHLFPMIFALFAISVGLCNWFEVNHFTPPQQAAPAHQPTTTSPESIDCLSKTIQANHSILTTACINNHAAAIDLTKRVSH